MNEYGRHNFPTAGRWFAALVRPHAERLATINIQRQGFPGYCPARIKTVRHARQFRTSMAPLFPGYVFVKLDTSADRWRAINGTFGVVSLVMAGAEPLPLPIGVVEALMEVSTKDGVVGFEALQLGQQVKLLAGPFAEQLGTLERLDDRGRVQVLLEMMGTFVRVSSRADQLATA